MTYTHAHTVTPSVSFCRRGCRPFFTDRMRAERIDHGIKSSSIYQYPKRDRYKGDDPNRHQSPSHFCSARAIPLVHMIYASRDSRAGRYRFIFTPSPRASLSHSLLFRRDRRRSLLIPPISVPLLLLPPSFLPPRFLARAPLCPETGASIALCHSRFLAPGDRDGTDRKGRPPRTAPHRNSQQFCNDARCMRLGRQTTIYEGRKRRGRLREARKNGTSERRRTCRFLKDLIGRTRMRRDRDTRVLHHVEEHLPFIVVVSLRDYTYTRLNERGRRSQTWREPGTDTPVEQATQILTPYR